MAPGDCLISSTNCSRFDGFQIYRAYSYGIYTQTDCSIEINNCVLVDNSIGIFTMILRPDPVAHQFANKFTTITNSLLVGMSDSFDCSVDQKTDDFNLQTSPGKPWFVGDKGRVGVSLPLFSQDDNMWPEKPFHLAKKYPAMYGEARITGMYVYRAKQTFCQHL